MPRPELFVFTVDAEWNFQTQTARGVIYFGDARVWVGEYEHENEKIAAEAARNHLTLRMEELLA